MSHNPVCYGPGVPNLDVYSKPIVSKRNPATSDINYPIGQVWVNQLLSEGWILVSKSAGLADWIEFAVAGGVGIDTITGGSGGALSPTAGNINILGTANQITSSGAGSTLTLSIPSTFIAPGSIASTTTLTGGTGITATTGNIIASTGNITSTLGSVAAATTVIAGTSITATLGNITATNGNLVLGTAGNKLSIATGANASIGTSAALSGTPGTITISTTAVTAASKIFVSRNTVGGTLGNLSVPTASIVAGTSFVINSDANETSTINWLIIN